MSMEGQDKQRASSTDLADRDLGGGKNGRWVWELGGQADVVQFQQDESWGVGVDVDIGIGISVGVGDWDRGGNMERRIAATWRCFFSAAMGSWSGRYGL